MPLSLLVILHQTLIHFVSRGQKATAALTTFDSQNNKTSSGSDLFIKTSMQNIILDTVSLTNPLSWGILNANFLTETQSSGDDFKLPQRSLYRKEQVK